MVSVGVGSGSCFGWLVRVLLVENAEESAGFVRKA